MQITKSMRAKVAVFTGRELAAYGFGEDHPFGHDRLAAFEQEYRERGLYRHVDEFDCAVASREEIERFHTSNYVELVKARSLTGEGFLDEGDTPAFKGVYEAGATVVGTVLTAARQIMHQEFNRAFIPIAGLHHARRDKAAGFCVFNDCGVLIESLLEEFGLPSVAYVDIDAHHGDGVFYGFESDPRVLFADIHEDGRFLYPGTGAIEETGVGEAEGMKLNLPVPPGSDDKIFHICWNKIEAYLDQYHPAFILLQSGADSIAGDPITHMNFSSAAHAYAARRLCLLADRYAHGRLLVMGGGGYNRQNLATAWSEVIKALIDAPDGA